MLFRLSAIFFAATSIAASSVPVGRQAGDAVACTLVLDPQTPVSASADLEAEFNFRACAFSSSTCI